MELVFYEASQTNAITGAIMIAIALLISIIFKKFFNVE